MVIAFDLDGTLLNTIEDLHESLNYVLSLYKYNKVSLDDTRQFLGNGIRNLIIKGAKTDINIDKMFVDFKNYYEANCMNKTFVYDGIKDLIIKLKENGHKIVCITNKNYIISELLIENYFPSLFDLVLGDGMGYKRKPDCEIINALIDKMGCKKEDIIYFGDSEVDAKTIINSNIKGALVSYGFRDKELLKEFNLEILDNAHEIELFINRN